MSKQTEEENSFMVKVSTFIVDKRNLFFLLFALMIVFSVFAMNWVKVENALSAYLPDTTETRRGLDRMEEEFTTYGTASVMVSNINYEDAREIADEIEARKDVSMLVFDNQKEHYNNFSALYEITFAYPQEDERCLTALDEIRQRLKEYDLYVSTDLGNQQAEQIESEMQVVSILVAIIVVTVLILTSQTYAEVPVLLLTSVAAALITKGTNYLLGTISFVSNLSSYALFMQ